MSQFANFDKTFITAVNLDTSTAFWRPVYINSATGINVVNTTTVATNTIGILQNVTHGATGATSHVRLGGTSKIFLNDTCTAGDVIIVGSTGAIRGTSLTQTANYTQLGRALEVSSISGTIIEIFMDIRRIMVPTDTTTSNVIAE